MSEAAEFLLEAGAADAAPLQVRWRKTGETFWADLLLNRCGRTEIEICSLASNDSFAAMRIQEIVEHTTADNRSALLLTGAGEGRYWSTSIEAFNQPKPILRFDVACRIKTSDTAAPSIAYRLADGVQAELLKLAHRLRLCTPAGPAVELRILDDDKKSCSLTCTGRMIEIAAPAQPTMTWRYEFVLVDGN